MFSEAEAAAFEKQVAARQTATTNNGYDWWMTGPLTSTIAEHR